jgi:tetratricopeptide (TPR) repeat protein
MLRLFGSAFTILLLAALWVSIANAQTSSGAATADSTSAALHAVQQAEAGNCSEALPALNRAFKRLTDKPMKRRAGLAGVHCAMTLGQPDAAADFIAGLNRDFPHDPEVLYVLVHAYSDLSTLAAQDLARHAPSSAQAHELSAEAFEQQGKWDLAAAEYRAIVAQNPDAPGIHFRLGRLLISQPNPSADIVEQARKEFQAELKIDPSNAGAEYVLGELARQDQNWEEAIHHFSRASKLDLGFGDAFLGLGESLVAAKKFPEAITPLETAAKLEPANPATHYNLATAYSRTGRKAEADREFAIHREMTQKSDTDQTTASPNSPPADPK